MDRPYRILFISRHNSARTLMAEAVTNSLGASQFEAVSAGVEPDRKVDPMAISVLKQAGYATSTLRPKHWSEFSGPDAPQLDFVFTLRDTAAREIFPSWPGASVSADWRYPDPKMATGEDWRRRREYVRTLTAIERQMRIFVQLPFESLYVKALKRRLDELGQLGLRPVMAGDEREDLQPVRRLPPD